MFIYVKSWFYSDLPIPKPRVHIIQYLQKSIKYGKDNGNFDTTRFIYMLDPYTNKTSEESKSLSWGNFTLGLSLHDDTSS